jgi:hypothetical protein
MLKKTNNDYVVEIIRYYRNIGFFSKYKDLSEDELIKKIKEFIIDRYEIDIDEYDKTLGLKKYLDALVLSFDTGKIINQNFVEEISNRNVKWRFLHLFLLVFTSIDFSYFFYKILNKLTILWNANSDSLLLNLENRYYWLALAVTIGGICGGYASKFLMYSILQEKVLDYILYLNLFNLSSPIKSKNIKYISIFTLAVSFIFIALGLN